MAPNAPDGRTSWHEEGTPGEQRVVTHRGTLRKAEIQAEVVPVQREIADPDTDEQDPTGDLDRTVVAGDESDDLRTSRPCEKGQ